MKRHRAIRQGSTTSSAQWISHRRRTLRRAGPVTEIFRAALNLKTQLIVIGVTRRTRLGSKLFGKTGKLLRDAHCPILAVPIPAIARHATDNVRKEAA